MKATIGSVLACICGLVAITGTVAYASAAAMTAPTQLTRPGGDTLESLDRELARMLVDVRLAPTPEHHRRLAEAYLRRRVVDAAFEHYTAAIGLAPADAAAHEGLAVIWREWGFDEQSLAEAHRAVYHAPWSASAHNTLGTCLSAAGDLKGAREEFHRALELDPVAAYAVSNLCYLELKVGNTAGALDLCDKALAIDPMLQSALNLKGIVHGRIGDFAAAHREFLRAGTPSQAAYKLGLSYMTSGRLNEAALAFEAALAGDAMFSSAHARLRQVNKMRAQQGINAER